METRANYLLIGAFTLAGFLGLLGFLLWFARVELDRQFDYYDILFPTVTGLSNASEVRFSGLPVGQVVEVALAPDRSGQVRVRIEVDAFTPVRTSSQATIEALGVTGVGYVNITAGNPSDPLLQEASDEVVPDIPSTRSVLQTISEDAPAILEQLLDATEAVSDLLGPANQERISNILANVETASGDLTRALEDFSSVTETIAAATEDITLFTGRLEEISAAATTTLETADGTLRQVSALAERAGATLEKGDAALDSGTRALDAAASFLEEDVPGLVTDLDATLASLRTQIEAVSGEATAMLDEFRQTGSVATERLRQAESVIASADRVLAETTGTLQTVEAAAARLTAFIDEDGEALVADARTFLANANEVAEAAVAVAENDLPAILTDIRSATATAAEAVERVSADLSSAAGRVDGIAGEVSATLDTVTTTFANANDTLTRINGALETGDAALAAAESAFTSADRVLNEEVGAIVADLQATLARLDEAVVAVTADVPAITEEIRRTAESASAAFSEVRGAAETLAPAVNSFATEGLPQYSRLGREARELVENLQQLVRQIERDPARYFLGGDAPAFRR